jgi:hypothetical protein
MIKFFISALLVFMQIVYTPVVFARADIKTPLIPLNSRQKNKIHHQIAKFTNEAINTKVFLNRMLEKMPTDRRVKLVKQLKEQNVDIHSVTFSKLSIKGDSIYFTDDGKQQSLQVMGVYPLTIKLNNKVFNVPKGSDFKSIFNQLSEEKISQNNFYDLFIERAYALPMWFVIPSLIIILGSLFLEQTRLLDGFLGVNAYTTAFESLLEKINESGFDKGLQAMNFECSAQSSAGKLVAKLELKSKDKFCVFTDFNQTNSGIYPQFGLGCMSGDTSNMKFKEKEATDLSQFTRQDNKVMKKLADQAGAVMVDCCLDNECKEAIEDMDITRLSSQILFTSKSANEEFERSRDNWPPRDAAK